MRAMLDAAVVIDYVCPVMEPVACIEGEEFFFDGNSLIARGWDCLKQVECASEFLVKDRAGQDVAGFRAAIQKEPAPIRSSAS